MPSTFTKRHHRKEKKMHRLEERSRPLQDLFSCRRRSHRLGFPPHAPRASILAGSSNSGGQTTRTCPKGRRSTGVVGCSPELPLSPSSSTDLKSVGLFCFTPNPVSFFVVSIKEWWELFTTQFFSLFLFLMEDTEIMGTVNSKSSSARQRQCKQKSAQTSRGLNFPHVTTVILLSCHHLQINYGLTSATGMSRRRCFKIFVADQLLDSSSPGLWFITDTFWQFFYINLLTD